MHGRVCSLFCLALLSAGAHGESATTIGPLQAAFMRGAAETRAYLEGPKPYRSGSDDRGKSCVELYDESVALLPGTYDYQPTFYDDSRNYTIAAVGLVAFTEAFYAWPIVALQRQSTRQQAHNTEQRLNELRAEMGRRRCFEH